MKTVWKYPLRFSEKQTIRMPRCAEIMCVQVQNDKPCLWALVDDDNTVIVWTARSSSWEFDKLGNSA